MQSPPSNRVSYFGRTTPQSICAFAAQTFILTVIILASIINLALEKGEERLWISLLSTALGLCMPSPSVKLNWLPTATTAPNSKPTENQREDGQFLPDATQ